MKDERGLYYYPFPGQKGLRMYVRLAQDDVEFRPWSLDDPSLWDDHGWVAYSALLAADRLAQEEGRRGPPMEMYDISVAIRLIKDEIMEMDPRTGGAGSGR